MNIIPHYLLLQEFLSLLILPPDAGLSPLVNQHRFLNWHFASIYFYSVQN